MVVLSNLLSMTSASAPLRRHIIERKLLATRLLPHRAHRHLREPVEPHASTKTPQSDGRMIKSQFVRSLTLRRADRSQAGVVSNPWTCKSTLALNRGTPQNLCMFNDIGIHFLLGRSTQNAMF